MMRSRTIAKLAVLGLVALAVVFPVAAYGSDSDEPAAERTIESLDALGTDFTFQGRLTDAGAPANGTYDFTFYLYDSLAGGAQVGVTNTIGDVAVSAGLFTVSLNFGDQFHGAQYYLEVQVRPGASAGVYTVLSPREPIGSVPNASYAGEAGSLLLPQDNSASFNGPLLTISNTSGGASGAGIVGETASTGGSAVGVKGHATSTGAGNAAGVFGTNDSTGSSGYGVLGTHLGGGTAVQGTSATGPGIAGFSFGGPGGVFSSLGGNAIEISGPIKVAGSAPAAFVHTATPATIGNHVTTIDNPATNNNPNAILIVTKYWTGVYDPNEIGVYYTGGKWRIFYENIVNQPGLEIVPNSKFNVLVINQ